MSLPVLDTFAALAAATVSYAAFSILVSPLNRYPGSLWAALGDVWRLLTVWSGKAHQIQRDLHERHHSSIVRLGRKAVSVNDPEFIETIYSSENVLKKSSFYAVQDTIINGKTKDDVFSTRNEKWHATTAESVRSLYAPSTVVKKEAIIDKTIQDFYVRLEELFIRDRASCDLHHWLHFFAMDLITALTFERPVGFIKMGSDIDGIIADSKTSLEYRTLLGQVSWVARLLNKIPYLKSETSSKSSRSMHLACRLLPPVDSAEADDSIAGAVDDTPVDSAFATPTSTPTATLFDTNSVDSNGAAVKNASMLGEKDEATPTWALARIAAFGADKLAIELRAVVYFLARNPAKRAKLIDELDAASLIDSNKKVVDASTSRSLPYLNAVIKEALRLHPAIALPLERVVSSSGLVIRKGDMLPHGTAVGINPAVIGFNKSIYGDNVDDFEPERWLQRPGEDGASFRERADMMERSALTFGHGKRACPAKQLADVALAKTIATFFSRLDVSLAHPDREWRTRNVWLHYQWDMDCLLLPRTPRTS